MNFERARGHAHASRLRTTKSAYVDALCPLPAMSPNRGLVLLLGTLWLASLTCALENGLSRTPHRGWSRSVKSSHAHVPQASCVL